tara:strand:- start:1440 stop:1925 length:486 start_codon:yes stop_codon:yes gene_type:complete
MSRKQALMLTNLPEDLQHRCYQYRGKSPQTGSALVIAIFAIIVMSLLGAALVNMLDSSQEGVAYEVLGTRAYTAAQSGLQWQLSEVFPLNSDAIACKIPTEINSLTPTFNNVPGLAQCSINVTCVDFVLDSVRYYTITSTSECAIDGEVTSRRVAVEAHSL